MRYHLFSLLLLLCLSGCTSSGAKPANPFAQNLLTVPPPSTFSSQESYLGQTPGAFVPQVPATTFPTGAASPTQPAASPADSSPPPSTNADTPGATVFTAAEQNTGWTAVDVAATSRTAFQAMEAKVDAVAGVQTDMPESLVVGTSHVVTSIVDASQPEPTLSEPQSLYSGKY